MSVWHEDLEHDVIRLSRDRAQPAPHKLYDEVAEAAADVVLRRYSTSFGLASRLLAGTVRTHVRNIYALVRVADEVVDAPRPGGGVAGRSQLLADLHREVAHAVDTGHSANLVVHAFARTARTCGIDAALYGPFFASMRMDLERTEHDADSLARYIHGSAEVVGLMCLRAFLVDTPDRDRQYERLQDGASRLGAAFQKVNFLRDLGSDVDHLGRRYFPGLDIERFDRATRDRLLDDIEADLQAAAVMIPSLPAGSRRAVCAAHLMFAELACRLRRTDPAVIRSRRVRVPAPRKAQLIAIALARGAA